MKTIILQNNKSLSRLAFVLLLSFIFLAPALRAQSLVGWWKMDEGSGTTLIDSSGLGNNGTTVGSPTWTTGVITQALSLNGTTQYATVPDVASLDCDTAITIAVWINPTSLTTQYIIKKAKISVTDGYELSISSDSSAFFRINQSISLPTTLRVDTKNPLTANTWVHIACTFNGTTLKIYRNGILDSSKTVSTTTISTNGLNLGIGAEPDGTSKFHGAIDDARIYNYSLTAAQILALASAIPPPVLNTPSNGSIGQPIPITLNWYASYGATSYRVQVSTVSDFSSTVYNTGGIGTTSTSVSGLAINTLYYWRVNDTTAQGTSGWSTVWNFTPNILTIINNGAGYCLNFNGTNNYVTVPDNDSLDLGSAATIEAWIKPNATTTQRFVSKGNSSGFYIFLSASGGAVDQKVSFQILTAASTGPRVNSTTTYPTDGTWIHVAATYGSGTMKLYINGFQEGGDISSADIIANTAAFTIGVQSNLTTYFNGAIDEVRVWRVVRTQTEIRDYMCKKLSGSESRLVGYWRFNEDSGTAMSDETANNFDGTLNGTISSTTHDWSGAALGSASAYDYDATGGYSVKIGYSTGDTLTATTTSGTITGIQAYRVDDNSIRTLSTEDSSWTVDPLRYWGVKAIGTSTPTYTVVYNYSNHPGINTETNLRLDKRDNISDASWTKVIATLDSSANTLTATGQTGTEYSLASSTDDLPVELSSFSASIFKNAVKLNWRTETEVSNYGFEVERKILKQVQNDSWETIGFVQGNGNSNSPKDYSFTDDNVMAGKYSYRLKQIDTDGQFSYSKTIEVDFGSLGKFELSQNYPNPFNPVTTIRFSIPQSGNVKLTVFNVLGEQVTELVNGFRDAGVHTINFDASKFNSGLYLYKIESNGLVQTRKMLLVK